MHELIRVPSLHYVAPPYEAVFTINIEACIMYNVKNFLISYYFINMFQYELILQEIRVFRDY